MLRLFCYFAVACLAIQCVCGRQLAQAPAAEAPAPAAPAAEATSAATGSTQYATFTAALEAASSNSELSTLVAAINAAGVQMNESAKWTILAPLNQDFEQRLLEDLGITPAQMLENKTLVTEILSYHVIPGAALTTDQLTEGQALQTALAGQPPLVVQFDRSYANGTARAVPQIEFSGATNKAEVRARGANIRAGNSVIHLIDDVLLPRGVGRA